MQIRGLRWQGFNSGDVKQLCLALLGSLGNGCSIRTVNILIMVNDYVIMQRFGLPIRDVPPSIVCQKFNKCLDFYFFIIHKAVHPKSGGL